jgi:hypothetical protein
MWVNFETMLWISYVESHIWVNFAPSQSCGEMNNRGWIKAMMNNSWQVHKIQLPYKWCRLYPFASIEDYWKSLANTLRFWYAYAWCNDVICLSKKYVWWAWVNWDRVNRVNWF